MQHLDLQVIEQALKWSLSGRSVWLCTVLKTFGSSPREPGAMMAACDDGQHIGSLSGGCIEDDFLLRLKQGEFNYQTKQIYYGIEGEGQPKVTLPCGGRLDVLVEYLVPDEENQQHLEQLHKVLLGQASMVRVIDLQKQTRVLCSAVSQSARVEVDELSQQVRVCCGPVTRLIIVGCSTVSIFCAQYAQMMGYDVILCEHREERLVNLVIPNVRIESVFPADFIHQPHHVHVNTAIVALTHDPRIDDLAMMDAVKTPAFYIGVMGSQRTSEKRAERLKRSGELSDEQIKRIHMPIGLNLGSKTPAEIALAVMADILRVNKKVIRYDL
ncbi:XdhC family protein [Marinomonas sp.]|nr:XdhC family protein [Marinomonas sp.]MDB4836990.1 XdhC family protein [Marinomonas sp.]